jgi:hypothetical protein
MRRVERVQGIAAHHVRRAVSVGMSGYIPGERRGHLTTIVGRGDEADEP